MVQKYVIYRRVSTKRQGDSGLGLEAQVRDIDLFLANYSPEPYEVLATFTDVKSGKDAERQALKDAIELAREHSADLLVSKLDRISRDVELVARLLKDKRLKLRVASMPHADKFSLHIYAALAEQERDFISLRTKQALAAAKARGTKLGGLRDATMKRNRLAIEAADAAAHKVSSIIVPMRRAGATLQAIACALNNANVPTPRNRKWAAMSVKNALDRLTTEPATRANIQPTC